MVRERNGYLLAQRREERNQAITLFKKLLFAWSRGSIGYTWYDLRNDIGYYRVDGEHNGWHGHRRLPAEAGLFRLHRPAVLDEY
ncbi:MAG: hypothetical protein V8T86_12910 [Victivallis sp.]